MTISAADDEAWVESVVELRPRMAAFDCDGTLWSIDSGVGFLEWELERHVVSPAAEAVVRAQYSDYLAGIVSEETMSGYLVTMHEGLANETVEAAARDYVTGNLPRALFDGMIHLLERLGAISCDIWLVSSSNQWVIEAGAAFLGLPPGRVLAAAAAVDAGRVTGQLLRVPCGAGKRRALETTAPGIPDIAFGNSRWDAELLAYARNAYAVHPTAELARTASERNWQILYPRQTTFSAGGPRTAAGPGHPGSNA